jgi:hypothetical protein
MAKKIETEKEPSLSSVQACLELKIIGYYKGFVFKKYKNQSYTLKKDGLEF